MRLRCIFLWIAAILPAESVWAHGIVGNRMFIEPLFTEDANVKNEFVIPFTRFTVQPDGTWRQIGFSFEKQLCPDRFSVVFEGGRINKHDGPARLSGWDNLELGLKYEAYINEPREFVLSPALFATFPVGSSQVVEDESSLTPMLLFGKGFGDLPAGFLRPLAIQGDAGVTASYKSPHDKEFRYDVVLMYSIPYLNHWVRNADSGYAMEHSLRRGVSRAALLGNLFPYVEFNGTHPIGGQSKDGTFSLRPGILWMGKYVQVSLAADISVRSPFVEDRPHKGFCFSLDWFLDEILPAFGWTPSGGHANHP